MSEILKKIKYFFGHPIVRYYTRHPVILAKNRTIVFFLWLKKIFKQDVNFDDNVHSDIPIDIVIAAVDKDYDVLVHVIDSIRLNIKHPVGDIIVISPNSESIIKLCEEKKCTFVDENTVLPITKKDIDYSANGVDRSGWLFQQFLKWSGDKYAKNEYFLIADADTIFCRPQVFINKNKVLLPVNNQLCHIPYFDAYKKLIGNKIKPLINFTSHHSLFQKSKLRSVKQKIEKQCKNQWHDAIINNIDKREGSSISVDYETYGQFVYSNYPNDFILEHWFNLSLNRKQLNNLPELMDMHKADYKSISFHSYK